MEQNRRKQIRTEKKNELNRIEKGIEQNFIDAIKGINPVTIDLLKITHI